MEKSLIPDSGDGVFALVDFDTMQCTCMCTGYLYNGLEEIELRRQACDNNVTLTMDERRQCKKYSLGSFIFEQHITIPPNLDQPDVFLPSAGLKVRKVTVL